MRTFQIHTTEHGRGKKYTFTEDNRGNVKIYEGENQHAGGSYLPKPVVEQLKAFLQNTTGEE
jgi:hypothetical protein